MRIISFILLLLIILLGITFAYLNAAPVVFNYYLGSQQLPLSLLLVCSLGLGILLGIVFALFPIIKLKSKNLKLKRRLKCAEQEVENLRSIPIKDSH